jgi:hypothetical protein
MGQLIRVYISGEDVFFFNAVVGLAYAYHERQPKC